MAARRPPQPEPPPRRRRSIRGERPWRTSGPAGEVTTVRLAERVMRARTESICPRCKCPVGVGVQIGLIPGSGWCHVRPCIVGGRMPMIGPSSGA
ncbi:MAG TPA: hypothetical protein VMU94_14025 [Streptosporangiaceae bacterium]|nr:hypothetical protein [Streptosporangiaceae bacterium]